MVSLQSYLNDPCGTTSIPYWKYKRIAVPSHMRIVHERDMEDGPLRGYTDEPYFRLYHDLRSVPCRTAREIEIVPGGLATDAFVQLINASYTDLSVTAGQIESLRHTPVYCPDLWILLKDRETGAIVAGGIADLDREIGELILEWIQVLPSRRRRGYGQLVVCHLLSKARKSASFATVSGKLNDPNDPEGLYRKCGFTGDDIWHILTRSGHACEQET